MCSSDLTETFWAAIRDYYARYRDRNASTAELRAVFEEHSKQDLGWFFEQWLTRAGSPVIDAGIQNGVAGFGGGTLHCHCDTDRVEVRIDSQVMFNHACGCSKC